MFHSARQASAVPRARKAARAPASERSDAVGAACTIRPPQRRAQHPGVARNRAVVARHFESFAAVVRVNSRLVAASNASSGRASNRKERNMKKLILSATLLGALGALAGCSYAGVAASGDKVVVLRNGLFSNSAYVCKVADNGVSSCTEGESP
jgi:hypothetical protein